MEVQDELQSEISYEEVNQAEITSDGAITLQDIETLNNNIVMGFLYITGALGIIAGILLGRAFNGIFRSK